MIKKAACDQCATLGDAATKLNRNRRITTTAHNGDRVWVNGPDGFYLEGNREPAPNDPFIYTEKSGRNIFNLYEHGSGSTLSVCFQICATKKD